MEKPTLKFGINQLKNPTPKAATYIFRTYSFLAGLWAIIAPSLDILPMEIISTIDHYLLIGVPVIQFTIKFFGWDYSDKPDTDSPQ